MRSVRSVIAYGAFRAMYSRPAPAPTKSTPRTIPIGLPMSAMRTINAMPMRSMAAARIGVVVRRTSWGVRMSVGLSLGSHGLEPPATRHARRGLDDHAARAIRQHGLDGAVEEGAAAARRERHHDRPRAHLLGLV